MENRNIIPVLFFYILNINLQIKINCLWYNHKIFLQGVNANKEPVLYPIFQEMTPFPARRQEVMNLSPHQTSMEMDICECTDIENPDTAKCLAKVSSKIDNRNMFNLVKLYWKACMYGHTLKSFLLYLLSIHKCPIVLRQSSIILKAMLNIIYIFNLILPDCDERLTRESLHFRYISLKKVHVLHLSYYIFSDMKTLSIFWE